MAKSSLLQQVANATSRELGMESKQTQQVAERLQDFLSSTYTLYLQTLVDHWNVVGPNFVGLHSLFEEQYQNLHLAGDEIAERIRALGYLAPSIVSELVNAEMFSNREGFRSSDVMVSELCRAHEQCSREAREVLEIAEQAEDYVTADLMTERMAWHDKTAWMLRSITFSAAESSQQGTPRGRLTKSTTKK